MIYIGVKNCDGCRYWSEMIAGAGGKNKLHVEAMCLAEASPHHQKYTVEGWTCPAFAPDTHGKIDGYPHHGEIARALYAEEAES